MNEEINDGGPAYPAEIGTGDLDGGFQCGNERWHVPGMSLRDHFASQSISAATKWEEESPTSSDGFPSFNGVARRAYLLADAMLRARATKEAA